VDSTWPRARCEHCGLGWGGRGGPWGRCSAWCAGLLSNTSGCTWGP
jgi:hypothetical protein